MAVVSVQSSGRTRAHATRSARRMSQRWAAATSRTLRQSRDEIGGQLGEVKDGLSPRHVRSFVGTHGIRWLVNCAVATLVLSLPVAASAASASGPSSSASPVVSAEAPRAQSLARGMTITAGRAPVTVNADGARPIREYTMGKADTLGSMSNFFAVSPESIAYANGITDPMNLEVGRSIRIPPGNGALYTVSEGDTIESVAERFKVDESVIKDYNRLHFEPQNFAVGQLVFVPGAELPALVYQTVDAEPSRPTLIARAAAPAAQAPAAGPSGVWPVAGVITQYMWGGHTGVDLAAPYGSTLVAVTSGVVSSTGWVAVGGLSVCVRDGAIENCYYHTGAVFVSPGQAVERGQRVASIGTTGVTTGPHVHWESKINGRFVNPLAQ